MKTLLLKDFKITFKYSFILPIFILIELFWAFFLSDDGFMIICFINLMIASQVATSSYYYDEQSNWQDYVKIMPIKDSLAVAEKYIMNLIVTLPVTLVFMIIAAMRYGALSGKMVGVAAACFVGGLLMHGILAPIIIKNGYDNAKGMIIVCALIIGGGSYFLLYELGDSAKRTFNLAQATPFWVAVIIASVIFYACSYFLALKIYREKDF